MTTLPLTGQPKPLPLRTGPFDNYSGVEDSTASLGAYKPRYRWSWEYMAWYLQDPKPTGWNAMRLPHIVRPNEIDGCRSYAC